MKKVNDVLEFGAYSAISKLIVNRLRACKRKLKALDPDQIYEAADLSYEIKCLEEAQPLLLNLVNVNLSQILKTYENEQSKI